MSPEQKRKMADARSESLRHQDSNAMNTRDGKDHEDHKLADLRNDLPAVERPGGGKINGMRY